VTEHDHLPRFGSVLGSRKAPPLRQVRAEHLEEALRHLTRDDAVRVFFPPDRDGRSLHTRDRLEALCAVTLQAGTVEHR